MSWTQVHVSGFPQTVDPTDEELEQTLTRDYDLATFSWAGEGTTVVKRHVNNNNCRGYCFLSFLTISGATLAVQHINATTTKTFLLKAELSQPKKQPKEKKKEDIGDTRNLRIRRQRGQPVRKHPVLVSSDQSKLARSTALRKNR